MRRACTVVGAACLYGSLAACEAIVLRLDAVRGRSVRTLRPVTSLTPTPPPFTSPPSPTTSSTPPPQLVRGFDTRILELRPPTPLAQLAILSRLGNRLLIHPAMINQRG